MLSATNRIVVDLHGIVLRDDSDFWLVDFTKEFRARRYNTEYQSMAQRVNGNACRYVNKK